MVKSRKYNSENKGNLIPLVHRASVHANVSIRSIKEAHESAKSEKAETWRRNSKVA